MKPINSNSQIINIIKCQLSNAQRKTKRELATATTATHPLKSSADRLATLLAQRVQAINPTQPDSAHTAFALFLETVLLQELGAELINDPAFHQLVMQVHNSMTEDPTLQPLIKQAGQFLLAQHKP